MSGRSSGGGRAARRGRGRGWLISLLVVAGVLVAADRIGVRVAQNLVAERLQQSQNLSAKPAVKIEGVPFLTQAVRGRYSDVRIAADGLVLSGQGREVRISHFAARLRDVTVARNFQSAKASSATGAALIDYADLSAAVGVPLSYAGNQRVTATKSISLLGLEIKGSVTAGVTVNGANTVEFTSPQVVLGDSTVPQQVTDTFARLLDKPIVLSGLPAGLRVRTVTVDAAGLTVTLTATDIALK